MLKTYKYKLRLNKTQTKEVEMYLNCCRYLYNSVLEYKKVMYTQFKKSLTYIDIQNELPILKKTEGFEFFNNISSDVLQNVVKRVDITFSNFFKKKTGFPKFQNKLRYNSFTFTKSTSFQIKGNKIKLPKLGWIKFFNCREILSDKLKIVTLIKEANGWYMSITFDDILHNSKLNVNYPEIDKKVSLDLGNQYILFIGL